MAEAGIRPSPEFGRGSKATPPHFRFRAQALCFMSLKFKKNESVILGVRISKLNLADTMDKIRSFLVSGRKHSIFTPNPEICLEASRNREFQKTLNRSSLNIADGFGLKLGGAILGQKTPHRITGVDLTWQIIKLAAEKKYKIMLLGGKGDIAKLAAAKIKNKFPNIQIVGAGEGLHVKYENQKVIYNSNENQKVINFINKVQPDILFVAFGAPKQEYWISKNILKLNSVKLAIGVGGTFDFISGKLKRAPKWIRKIGFEWLFRLFQEPKRIKRIFNALIIFPITCIKWRYGWQYKYRPNVANIIYNQNNQILLIFNPRFHYWTLPQGGMEKGEDLPTSSAREINEELGIEKDKLELIKILADTYSYDWPKNYQVLRPYKGQKQQFALWKFTGTEKDFDFKKSDEVSNIKWVDKKDLLKTIAPVRRKAIENIFKHL